MGFDNNIQIRQVHWLIQKICILSSIEFSQLGSKYVKGSSDPNHFIFEINIGKSRIRHRMIPNFEWCHFQSISKANFSQIESRSKSEPGLSDIDFKNKMALNYP